MKVRNRLTRSLTYVDSNIEAIGSMLRFDLSLSDFDIRQQLGLFFSGRLKP
jgi:hypothetical protein